MGPTNKCPSSQEYWILLPTAKSVEINVEFGGCSGFPHVVGPGIVDKNIHIKVKIHNSLVINSQAKMKIFFFNVWCVRHYVRKYLIIVYLKSNNMVKNPLNWNFKPRLLFIRKYIAEIAFFRYLIKDQHNEVEFKARISSIDYYLSGKVY